MSWYKSGAVGVVNGSATVSGAGTAFVGAVLAGYGFVGPDGRSYEVSEVVSATELTLASAYLGATQSGAEYGIFPTYAQLVSFNARLSQLLSDYQSIADGPGVGKFPNGTAALPSVSFASDPDTGMFWPSSNKLAWSTGGVERMALDSAGFEVSVPIIGSAVQASTYDPSPNRLLRSGAFGFNGSTSADICENVDSFGIRAGVYQVSTDFSSGVLPPDATVADVMLVLRPSGNQTTQFYSIPNDGNTYVRKSNAANSWGPWRRFMDSGNILGTVSQSGGVPTGAVIESGSNANGSYTRFADGLQICQSPDIVADITTAVGAIYRSSADVWAYPAAFVDKPFVSGGSVNNASFMWVTAGQAGTISCRAAGFCYTSVSNREYAILAIGRWF